MPYPFGMLAGHQVQVSNLDPDRRGPAFWPVTQSEVRRLGNADHAHVTCVIQFRRPDDRNNPRRINTVTQFCLHKSNFFGIFFEELREDTIQVLLLVTWRLKANSSRKKRCRWRPGVGRA